IVAADGSRQTLTVASSTSSGGSNITVSSFTANANYGIGSHVQGPGNPGDYLVAYDTAGNMLFSSNWSLAAGTSYVGNSLTNGVSSTASVQTAFFQAAVGGSHAYAIRLSAGGNLQIFINNAIGGVADFTIAAGAGTALSSMAIYAASAAGEALTVDAANGNPL